jgi:hypothetical protein
VDHSSEDFLQEDSDFWGAYDSREQQVFKAIFQLSLIYCLVTIGKFAAEDLLDCETPECSLRRRVRDRLFPCQPALATSQASDQSIAMQNPDTPVVQILVTQQCRLWVS